MSLSDTIPADSIGCIVNQSGLVSFSYFLWSELYCHLLLRSIRRRRVVCPIRKLPTWLTLVGLVTRVFDPLPVARKELITRVRTARVDMSLFSLRMQRNQRNSFKYKRYDFLFMQFYIYYKSNIHAFFLNYRRENSTWK